MLLSGFEPFGGALENPSQQVVQRLAGVWLDAAPGAPRVRIEGLVLPVAFGAAAELLEAAIARHRPRLVLALGLAPGRSEIAIERVALNLCDAPIADNTGAQPIDRPVLDGGAAALFATWPLRAALAALRDAGLPAGLSLSAGSYVCNELFYRLLHALRDAAVPAGFVHLPPASRLPLDAQVRAVRIALEAALRPDAWRPVGAAPADGRIA